MKFKLSNRRKIWLIVGGLAIAAGITGYVLWGRNAAAEEYITAKIERGAIRNTVSATGTLQAVTTVQVGSQVSGIIRKLHVDFNSDVSKGQVVAQLDPSIFQAQVSQQRANVEQSRANLADAEARVLAAETTIENQRAGVSSAAANQEALKALRDDARSNFQRQESLAASGVISQRDMEVARASYQAAEARHNQAAAQLAQARANEQQAAKSGLAQAQAAVKQAQAQLQQTQAALQLAEVNLSHTTIHSPIDGVVVSRNVDEGQTVAASLQAPTIFTIANDLTQMQVIANIDQADIGVINSSNRVGFTVDAFPGQNFAGTIRQIRLNPQNVQNVVTYNVVIDVENPELKLKPGMTANLTMTIAERPDVLKIPNAALRFRPADLTPEKLRELMKAEPQAEQKPAGGGSDQNKQGDTQANQGGERERRRQGERQANQGGERGQRRQGEQQASQGNDGGQRRRGEWRGNQGGEGGQRSQGRQGEQQASQGGEGGQRRQGERQAGAGERPSGDGTRRRERGGGGAAGAGGGGMMSTSAVVQGQMRIIWVLGADGKPQPRRVRLGITDGVNTEILEGELKEGEMVITALNSGGTTRPQTQTGQRPPGFGGGGGFGGGRPR